MKILYFLAFLFVWYPIRGMEQPCLEVMPTELKILIAQHLMTDDLPQTLKNIANYARINKNFHATINDPQNMIALIKLLARKYYSNETTIAKHLKNMSGMKTQEMQSWLKERENEEKLFRLINTANLNELKPFLESGININARKGRNKTTPLLWALSRLKSLIFWRYKGPSIALPADPEKIKNIIELLLNKNADPNIADVNGITPLMFAAETDADITSLLLNKNAKLNLKSKYAGTALDFAQKSQLPIAEKEKIIQLLKDRRALSGKDLP